MEPDDLEHLLSRMAEVSVVTVGDVMVDRFVYGEVHRVSAEAPIPVMARSAQSVMLGGCGNVARNVVALGGRSALVGVVGEDDAGLEARSLVGAEDRIGDGLVSASDRPTTVKTRFVSSGQQLLRVDHELAKSVPPGVESGIIAALDRAAAGTRAILLSDYGKGVVTAKVIEACLAAARRTGSVLIVDSKARGFAHYGPVDVLKPNAQELSNAMEMPTRTDTEVEAALAKALASCMARIIVVTRAARGISLAVRGEPVRHFVRPPVDVFDTSGAGDTALAALGLALGAGASIEDAVELALVASRAVVQKAGTATVSAEELLEAEAAANRYPADAKIASVTRMTREAARWRERGLKVGFTNGCFDILHPGHIAYLSQARSWCDRLIVGLNTDDSVKSLKGPGRPVNSLDARARVLAGLSSVDLVVAFAEPTPIALIEAARPDVLVKGADYALEAVVGRELVLGWGGEVRLAEFVDGHSTTSTLRRLNGTV